MGYNLRNSFCAFGTGGNNGGIWFMKGLFKRGIGVVICALMLAMSITAGISMVEEPAIVHAKVTASEKKKIQAYLDEYCIRYLEHCCYVDQTGDQFKFDSKKKTDMVLAKIACQDYMRDRMISDDALWQKYQPYGGLAKYDAAVKKEIAAYGKKLFGSSFKVSFAAGQNTKSFYPLSSDKKYILYNECDWGDWGIDHKYTGISKQNGTYTVKIKFTSGWWDYDTDRMTSVETDNFTVSLKKNGSSYVIKNIRSTK